MSDNKVYTAKDVPFTYQSADDAFDDWWDRVGQSFDPDTSDVPWYDKRRELARKAYKVALAHSRNYVADEEEMPEKITFGNGRIVTIQDNPDPNVKYGVYLEVE